MNICIYGAGGIGGYLAARLSIAGFNVNVIARGQNLDAIKKNGITLLSDNLMENVRVSASDEIPKEKQQYVLIATKTTALQEISPYLNFFASSGATLVPLMNGIPHWYFFGTNSIFKNSTIKCLDPNGKISKLIPWTSILGTVVYPACELIEPGVVRHIYGNRFSIGELSGNKTDRVIEFSKILSESRLRAPIRKDIRTEIWVKLMGNLALNSISALTSSSIQDIIDDHETRKLAINLMDETQNVANSLGIKMPISIEKRLQGALDVGHHKTSMLQDIENGRNIELDSIVTAVKEMGILSKTPTPTIDIVHSLLAKKASILSCQ